MTKDTPVEQRIEDTSLKDTQQQQKKPFEIVLVDIKKAAAYVCEIHCVKLPLEGNEEELKYVALSYRWGELQETLIDTKLGYTASITSFDLDDFSRLCYAMTQESDFQDIKYVWVDAICVDQRPAKRKSTIYQMSNIYERATYILAVPDLHKSYLQNTSKNNCDIMWGSHLYNKYIYHLVHGNSNQLTALDEEFLDDAKVPTDPILRHVLKKYTDYFTDGFMKYKEHDHSYCSMQAFHHICEITAQSAVYPPPNNQTQTTNYSVEELHHCHEAICPLSVFENGGYEKHKTDQLIESNWKTKIIERNTSIRQSMEFCSSLIKDWSTRVWVISEFNIAKKKNNLKFWFIQLSRRIYGLDGAFTFFQFDFDDTHLLPSVIDKKDIYSVDNMYSTIKYSSNPVHIELHSTMVRQLRQQTFLEMILKSKASKNGNYNIFIREYLSSQFYFIL
ncbi:unnamed protein product [Absidia cylindrospora]